MDMTAKQKEQTVSEFAVGDLVEFVEEIDGIKVGTRATVKEVPSGAVIVDLHNAQGGLSKNLYYFKYRVKKVHKYKVGDIVRYVGPVQQVVGTEMQVGGVEVLSTGKQYLRGTVTKAVESDWFVEDRPISFRESEAEPVEEVVAEPEAPFKIGDRVEFVEFYDTAVIGTKGTVTNIVRSSLHYAGNLWLVTVERGDEDRPLVCFEQRIKLSSEEPQFKVGDKVSVLASSKHACSGEGLVDRLKGDEFTYDLVVRFPYGGTVAFYFHEVELLPEPAQAYPDLAVGDWVEIIDFQSTDPERWIGHKGQVTKVIEPWHGLNENGPKIFADLEDGREVVLYAARFKKIDTPEPRNWAEEAEVGTHGYVLSSGSNKLGRILTKLDEQNWEIQYPRYGQDVDYYTIHATRLSNEDIAALFTADFIRIN